MNRLERNWMRNKRKHDLELRPAAHRPPGISEVAASCWSTACSRLASGHTRFHWCEARGGHHVCAGERCTRLDPRHLRRDWRWRHKPDARLRCLRPAPDHIRLTLSTPKGYINERFDPETGLQYLHARYYDSLLGRFLSPDTWDPTRGRLPLTLN
jgi:RHS repeat-associated protein